MKNTKVIVANWEWDEDEVHYDIDWPRIHREYGADRIKWITDQDHVNCQLLLEQEPESNKVSLVIEFYNPETLVEYRLRWAK
jgi:hypothetical protein